jgi:RNA polymerase sigma-70 factor (ECF subfamily)
VADGNQKYTSVLDILPHQGVKSGKHTTEAQVFIASLYKRYFDELVRDLRSVYGAGPPDPEDVAQQSFEKLNGQKHPELTGNPEGFLWVCSRNIIMTAKRAERVRTKNTTELSRRYFGSTCDTFDPERVYIAKERLGIVTKTLEMMPERRRRIFLLNRVHGLTPEQAGAQCGVSRSSAVRHIALATAQIAENVSEAQERESVRENSHE